MLYKSLIRPPFVYCDVIFDGITAQDSNKLQKLQSACIKNILNVPKRSSTAEIHKQAYIDLLVHRRWKHVVTEMFKVTKNLQPHPIINMFHQVTDISSRSTRRGAVGNLYSPLAKLEMTRKGFRHRGYHAWEKVPD